jgi:hypothetical protein
MSVFPYLGSYEGTVARAEFEVGAVFHTGTALNSYRVTAVVQRDAAGLPLRINLVSVTEPWWEYEVWPIFLEWELLYAPGNDPNVG